MKGNSALIADDEAALREMIRVVLEAAGIECFEAANAQEAYIAIVEHRPSVVLLDWMMPVVSGIELLRKLRSDEMTRAVPVIMLSAKREEDSKVIGLRAGADDYVAKPFSPRELLARIRAVLRRCQYKWQEEVLEFSEIRLEPVGHRVFVKNSLIDLPPTEFRLLKYFLVNQDRVLSRRQLVDHVWATNAFVEERTVDVHIRRLRNALRVDGIDYGDLIHSVYGRGYRLAIAESKYA